MVTMEGTLSKWTNVMQGWRYRYFVLDDNAGLFSYYTSKEKMVRGSRRGCVRLKGALVGIDDEDDATFTVTVDGKTFHFQAQDSEERESWIRALEDTVARHNMMRSRGGGGSKAAAAAARGRARDASLTAGSGPPPSMADFDKKLAETDSYLQLLINQVAGLKSKMDTKEEGEIGTENATAPGADSPPSATSNNEVNGGGSGGGGGRTKYDDIASKAVGMTESIKHAIVLLQIAKNAAVPPSDSVGVVKTFRTSSSDTGTTQSLRSSEGKDTSSSVTDSPLHSSSSTGVSVGGEAATKAQLPPIPVGRNAMVMQPPPPPKEKIKGQDIPEMSYSSSEDEFFDATDESSGNEDEASEEDDDEERAASVICPPTDLMISATTPVAAATPSTVEELLSPLTPTLDDNNVEIDFDALYEESDADEADVDMKSHGSVLTHLLSQVRIGMDLTKIVLPTFILERRSLLEMYSDFFAHPDLFVEITDGKTAEDRMVAVLKWYLSSFHAGRKSSIAKKPYNPIIGETFRCHWNLEETDGGGPTADKAQQQHYDSVAKESDLPWCGPGDLTFVAEQVSHHPPVSAFYAEHIKKKISVNAHIYTKSSFLGMSVAVHNIGEGTVNLLEHGEEYKATFPSGYGRSILTVPWVELGGKVDIVCQKTGYSAAVEFKCKQFFSSDCNKVAAEVFAPNAKKPLLKVDGEWNGKMMAKWASGKSELFIDVNAQQTHKKRCKLIADQRSFESRRLWKMVTYNLKHNHIEAATASKFALEQRQREEAAERKAGGSRWETKLFEQDDPNTPITGETKWDYKKPLADRLKSNQQ